MVPAGTGFHDRVRRKSTPRASMRPGESKLLPPKRRPLDPRGGSASLECVPRAPRETDCHHRTAQTRPRSGHRSGSSPRTARRCHRRPRPLNSRQHHHLPTMACPCDDAAGRPRALKTPAAPNPRPEIHHSHSLSRIEHERAWTHGGPLRSLLACVDDNQTGICSGRLRPGHCGLR